MNCYNDQPKIMAHKDVTLVNDLCLLRYKLLHSTITLNCPAFNAATITPSTCYSTTFNLTTVIEHYFESFYKNSVVKIYLNLFMQILNE